MTVIRRIAIAALIAALVYPVLLLLVSYVARDRVAKLLQSRMAEALGAEVTLAGVSLSLLPGNATLSGLKIKRDDGGHVDLDIAHASVDLAPLGWVLVDPVPRSVTVRTATISLSARGALSLRNPEKKRTPLRMGALRLSDIRIHIVPTSIVPGVGGIDLLVREAQTGPLHVQSAVDWLFALRALDAEIDLPMAEAMAVTYGEGMLTLRGYAWESAIRVPFQLPTPPADATEIDKVRLLAHEIVSAVGHDVAARWLKEKVKTEVKDTLLRALRKGNAGEPRDVDQAAPAPGP